MKKFLSLLLTSMLTVVIAAGIAGCSNGGSSTNNSTTEYAYLENADLYDSYGELKDKGFTEIILTQDGTGLDQSVLFNDESLSKEDFEFNYGGPWVITRVEKVDEGNHSISLIVNAQSQIDREAASAQAEEELESKLSYGHAAQAVEKYGESQFPAGFKLHSIAGIVSQEAIDGAWHLKIKCDVTNANGVQEKDLICEAVVSGTNENPIVDSFEVY